jgi:hypothetical protein
VSRAGDLHCGDSKKGDSSENILHNGNKNTAAAGFKKKLTVNGIIANISDDEGLVNNITSECQTEIIK